MRTIPSLLLAFLSAASLCAQEIPFQEFQAKVMKAYYHYGKEGLRKFTCGLESALVERKLAEAGLTGISSGIAKMALGLEFTLSYGPHGVSVAYPKGGPIGDSEKDRALQEGKEKARYWLEKGLGAWFFLSCPQGAQRLDPSMEAPRVVKTAKGWTMSLQRGEDKATLYFDPALTLTHADLYPKEEDPVRVKLGFEKTPKGLQLQVAQARYQGKVYRAQANYIRTRGALFPEKFVFSEVDPKSKAVSLLDTLTFENYEVSR